MVTFARNDHCRTLLSLLLYLALDSPQAPPASLDFSPHAEQRNDLGENISDIAGGRENPCFWHGINNFESMRIPNERQHQFRVLLHVLRPIANLISS
jgi:hypothetical protein